MTAGAVTSGRFPHGVGGSARRPPPARLHRAKNASITTGVVGREVGRGVPYDGEADRRGSCDADGGEGQVRKCRGRGVYEVSAPDLPQLGTADAFSADVPRDRSAARELATRSFFVGGAVEADAQRRRSAHAPRTNTNAVSNAVA